MKRSFFKRHYQASADSGSSSGNSEPTIQQLQQQAQAIQAKYDVLNQKIEKGELVDPATFVKTATEKGELYTKDRFVGLQQTLQKEKEAAEQLRLQMAAQVANEESLKSKASKLEEQLTGLQTTLKEKEAEVAQLSHGKKRTSIIMEKFPQLAPFESKGLLPQSEDESKLEILFGEFANQLGAIASGAKQDFGKGGGLQTPSGKGDATVDTPKNSTQLLKDAQAILLDVQTYPNIKDRQAAYDKAYDKYLEVALQESAVK